MASFRLLTLGPPRLVDSAGASLVSDDTRALGLAILLAIHEEDGVAPDELLLRLTPDATADEGRRTVGAAADRLDGALGPASIERGPDGWRFQPGRIVADVTLSPEAPPLSDVERAEFLSGFEIPGAPEFQEWAAEVRLRLGRGRAIVPTAPRRSLPGAVWVAALLTVGALAYWVTRAPPAVPFAPGDPLILADLDNATGDTLLDRSLTVAARVALGQSGHLQVVSRARIGSVLRRMQIEDSGVAITPALAREVAVRDGIRYVLGLRAETRDPGYELAATLVDVTTGQQVARLTAPAETRAGLLPALDQVLDRVRARLGEPAADRRARAVPLPQVTTPSLEALRSYANGVSAWSNGDYFLAQDLWQRAVALDTGFAMALGALGGWYYWHNQPAVGETYYREALRRRARLTDWERLRLEESAADYRGDHATAERIARETAERFPSVTTWYNYGTSLMLARRYQPAVDAFRRALTFEPDRVNVLINLATALKGLGRYHEAVEAYRRADERDSLVLRQNNVAAEYGEALFLDGRPDDARRHFEGLLDRPGLFERTLGHRGLAYLALARGRFDAAVGSFRQATEASRQQGSEFSIARGRMLEALALLMAGDSAEARRTLREVAQLSRRLEFAPQFLALAGHALVRAGDLGTAGEMLDLLSKAADTSRIVDRESAAFLAGDLLLAENRPLEARRLLAGAISYPQTGMLTVRTGEALAATGQADSAIALLAAPLGPAFGSEATFDWYGSRPLLADLLVARGHSDRARAVLDELARQWADGDRDAAAFKTLDQHRHALQP